MSIFSELFEPQELSQFLNHYLCRAPFAKPFKAAGFADVLSWNLMEEILSSHNNSWLPKNGKLPEDPDLNQGKLSYVQARKNFSEGRTILVRHAEKSHKKILKIAQAFEKDLPFPIDVQLYLTPEGNEGFDWHYDLEDVFVLQSYGEKEFRLLPNTTTPRPLPVLTSHNSQFHREKNSAEILCWLKAGDWLYIPAGYWHKAKALTDSFHISVGLMMQSPDIRSRLMNQLCVS